MRILLVVALASCEVLAGPPDLADQVRDARDRMHKRFAATTRMEHAIALGQLDRAREEARLVNALDEPDMLPEWKPYVDRIRATAREVVAAPDTVQAARSTARLGRQCAACHEASRAKIVFPKPPATLPGAKLGTQMVSHDWAAARMWEGLIGPDDARWLEGARRLSEARIDIAAEAGSLGIADDAARVRLLARRALVPRSQSERAELYGDLLATCAHCHFVIRD
jgi:hypothetical protein